VRINIPDFFKKHSNAILLCAPLAAFAVPIAWLFLLEPAAFDNLWKGRTFQLFFVWLILLELILGWDSLQKQRPFKTGRLRLGVLAVALALPTVYVVASNYFGLTEAILASSKQASIYWFYDMPKALEYLVFAGFFALMAYVAMGLKGLRTFAIPILFAVLIGAVFVIDSVYPEGQFTPFQFLVPATTVLAANVLGFMGYPTTLDYSQGGLPQLTVFSPGNAANSVSYGIAWPCAGIESLLIFAVTTLLFLKRMPMSWRGKVGYFVFGAAITYVINVFRIAGIFLYALGGGDEMVFHQSIGPLFPIAWIVAYPLIILASQGLWRRIRSGRRELLENPVTLSGAGG
jgi:thaumarchaeosortase